MMAILLMGVIAMGFMGGMPGFAGEKDSTDTTQPITVLTGEHYVLDLVLQEDLKPGVTFASAVDFKFDGDSSFSAYSADDEIPRGVAFEAFYAGNATYYSKQFSGITLNREVGKMTEQVAKIGAPTFSYVKNEDSSANSATNLATMAADDAQDFLVGIKVDAADAYVTNPFVDGKGYYVVSVKGNGTTTEYDWTKAEMPTCDKYTGAIDDGTFDEEMSWICEGAPKDRATVEQILHLESDGNVNENVTIRFDDITFFKNAETGEIEFGAVDEDNADLGQAAVTGTIYIE
ncbi:MAG: hypothetical protein U9M89_01310 [Patescibacteria group bacterium]|nr:hypothetical protein [Patescibacteria group bacterium]